MASTHRYTIDIYRRELQRIHTNKHREMISVINDAYDHRNCLLIETASTDKRFSMFLKDKYRHQLCLVNIENKGEISTLEMRFMGSEDIAGNRMTQKKKLQLRARELLEKQIMHREETFSSRALRCIHSKSILMGISEQQKAKIEIERQILNSDDAEQHRRLKEKIQKRGLIFRDLRNFLVGEKKILSKIIAVGITHRAIRLSRRLLSTANKMQTYNDEISIRFQIIKRDVMDEIRHFHCCKGKMMKYNLSYYEKHGIYMFSAKRKLSIDRGLSQELRSRIIESHKTSLEDCYGKKISMIDKATGVVLSIIQSLTQSQERGHMNNEQIRMNYIFLCKRLLLDRQSHLVFEKEAFRRAHREKNQSIQKYAPFNVPFDLLNKSLSNRLHGVLCACVSFVAVVKIIKIMPVPIVRTGNDRHKNMI